MASDDTHVSVSDLPIALDCLGGDFAPDSVVEGAWLAHQRFSQQKFLMFGPAATIEKMAKKYAPSFLDALEIIDCEEGIAPDEKPSQAVRKGRNSTMWRAIQAVRDGKASAAVSAGNTGALMAFSKLLLKPLQGIYRPAIVSRMPTRKEECVVLDLGANVECDAKTLEQFAYMGNAFARIVLHKEKPSVGLLNIGSEMSKGKDELKEAYQLLADSAVINFKGFVEANDITKGDTDVVVTDGFTGNVALKMMEGTASMLRAFIKESFMSSALTKLSYLFARGTIQRLRKRVDPRKYNGAMFIGLSGISIKSHGSADGYSFYHALKVAMDLVENQMNERIVKEMEASGALVAPQEAATQKEGEVA